MSVTVPVFRQNSILTNGGGGIQVQAASVIVGDSADNELTVTATGIETLYVDGFQYGYLFLQARQSDEKYDYNYPDEFALQVIQVMPTSVTFRVKRLDAAIGWGQQLQVDILFVPFEIIP